ncbi:MAG: excinuclease ABC subunit UvrA [Deltaproteobacteria bacterium]|nr:excinuclease ABC subunit UvrA [Deltaproteobacteria bacterium]
MAGRKPERILKERRVPAPDKDYLVIEGLRQNNLRNLTLAIPHNRITAVVGLSGSGKSSLAFDTLFAEGRWRFIESLSTYTRLFLERMDRPDLDAIRNIRPAIAVEQKNPVRTSRSTVGTATEINDYLRLVFARAGRLLCPECGAETVSHTPQSAAAILIKDAPGSRVVIGFTLDDKKTTERVAEELSKKGFYRVKSKGQVYNLAEEDLPYGLENGLEVITDRLIIKKEAAGRLAEAVETAFREGEGKAWAEIGEHEGKRMGFHAALQCPECGTQTPKPTPFSLSFNHPVGACPECKGFGNLLTYDTEKIIPDPSKSLRSGAIEPWTKPSYRWWHEELLKHAAKYGLDLDKPFARLSQRERDIVFNGTDAFDGINGFFAYLETKKYKLHVKVFTSRYKGQAVCPSCGGTRLRKSALGVRLGGKNIAEVSAMPVKNCLAFIKALNLAPGETKVADEPLRQLCRKLEFLKETGLGYITLDRQTKTLSGGEFQRISLATQLGSMLTGVLYILDEPSIGLHPVDVDMLTAQIKRLAAGGNTVVTVEHDPAVILAADHIVELGPGAGERGGNLVYCGPAKTFLSEAKTLTADYLTGRKAIHTPRWRRGGSGQTIALTGATGFNLKGVDVEIPLRTLTCVSGVSGSGKSTLIVDTLYNILAERFKTPGRAKPQPYHSISGLAHTSGVKLVDQSPIGRTPRSNPLTYIGGFDEMRKLYAGLPAARATGLTPRHFSFNVPGGRCEACKGEGVTTLEMYFLPDVYIKCAECNGRRYGREVLGVRYKGRSIHDCLAMTFEEAAAVFPKEPSMQRRFDIIRDVGLGYLRLGQSGLTLSGGEAQRLKIARELSEGLEAEAVYILDEPTTGLHPDDTKRLLAVLGRLVDSGSTVIVIEHNMDFLKCADHIIDLGPGGGEAGGLVVASGTPEDVAANARSVTGRYLKAFLR